MTNRFLWVMIFAVIMVPALMAREYIVLKNGKQFSIEGAYEIKGKFLVFKGGDGQLQQLPLQIVDLEKSKQMTEDVRAKEAARLAEIEEKKREEEAKSKYSSMAEIAEFVEKNRGADNPRPSRVVIDGEKVEEYAANNPTPTNSEASVSYSTDSRYNAENFKGNVSELSGEYKRLRGEVDRIEDQIETLQETADRYAAESSFGDEPTGAFYREMERTDNKIKELRTSLQERKQELAQVETQARQAGIGNIERVSGYQARERTTRANQPVDGRRAAQGRERETTRKTSGRARGDDDQ